MVFKLIHSSLGPGRSTPFRRTRRAQSAPAIWRAYCSAATLTERRAAAAAAFLVGVPDREPTARSEPVEPAYWPAGRIKALAMALDLLIEAQQATKGAASSLTRDDRIEIYIDDHYVALGASIWLSEWRDEGWSVAGQRLPYADLWREIDAQLRRLPLQPTFILSKADDPLCSLVADFSLKAAAALAQDRALAQGQTAPFMPEPRETRVRRRPDDVAFSLAAVQAAATKTEGSPLGELTSPSWRPDIRGLLSLLNMTVFRS